MEGLGIDWKILIGQIINFVILLWLLKRFVYKPFLNVLEKRKAKIVEGITKSEEAEKSLQGIRDLSKSIQAKGEEEARVVIKKAEIRAKDKTGEILAAAEEEKERIIKEAKITAEKEILERKKTQEKETIENTFILAEKFLKEKLNREKDKKFIEEILSNLK